MEKLGIHDQNYLKNIVLDKIKILMLIILGAFLGYLVVSFSLQSFIFLGAGLLLIAFIINPAKFLLFYLAIIPLIDQLIPFFAIGEIESRFGPHMILRGGITVLLAFYWLTNRRNPMIFWVSKPIFIFIPLIALSILYNGIRIKAGIISLSKITLWMLLVITVADLAMQGKMQIKSIYKSMLISIIFFVISLIFTQLFYGKQTIMNEDPTYGVGEFAGFFVFHSVSIGLSMGLIFILFLVTKQRNFSKLILLLFLCCVVLISIMRTYVRSGYVCSVIGIVMLGIMILRYANGEYAKQQKFIILSSIIIVIAVAIVYGSANFQSIERRFSDTTGSGRIDIWTYALKAYANFPLFKKLFGGGYEATGNFYKGTRMGPHNGYIFFLLEGGLLGLSSYIWFFVSLYRQIKLNVYNDYSYFILVIPIIVIFLTGEMTNGVFNIPSVTSYFSFLVGGTLGYYLSSSNKNNVVKEANSKVGLNFHENRDT